MENITIIPIGSGSTGNAFYIEIGTHRFMIDMGIGCRQIQAVLNRYQRSLNDLDAIFVTHGHTDHIKAAQAITNHTSCKVYANETIMYALRKIRSQREILNIDQDYDLDGLKVRMFKVPHDFVQTCGFTFSAAGRKLGYVTDCGKMSDKIIAELSGCDVIIIEANHDLTMLKNGPYPPYLQARIRSAYGHLSNDDCAETIARLHELGTEKFLLAHISQQNNTPQLAIETVRKRLPEAEIDLYACLAESEDLLIY